MSSVRLRLSMVCGVRAGLYGAYFLQSPYFVVEWRPGVLLNQSPHTYALKEIRIKEAQNEKGHGSAVFLQRCLWFAGVARNAVVVVLAAVLAFFVHQNRNDPLILTGNITPGLPRPRVPAFSTSVGNTTYTAGDMFSHLGTGILVVPIVGIISNVAIAKAFARGKTLDATQEIVALGICNVAGAFFRSFPVNGSFTRSAVSDASGVKSPAAGFYTSIIVLLTLALLTPYFYYIPRSALAAVIVCAVLHMVDIAIIKSLWKTSRLDLIPLFGTFVCCLALGIELGLICGVGVDVLLLLYYHSRPPLDVKFVDDNDMPPHYAIHPVGGLHFAGAETVRGKLTALRHPQNKINRSLPTLTVIPSNTNGGIGFIENGHVDNRLRSEDCAVGSNVVKSSNILVIYCNALYRMDYTFLQSIKMLVIEWSRSGRVIWCSARPCVKEQLESVLQDPIFCETDQLRIFLTSVSVVDNAAAISDTQL